MFESARVSARPGFSMMSSASSSCASNVPSEPRIAERMQVHSSEVVATHGMRAHIGISAKLRNVDGTHSFHSATRSSL